MNETLELLKAIKSGQELLVAKVDALDIRMARIEGSLKEVKEGQQRHERILEILSLKSVETDSYIKDFKERL